MALSKIQAESMNLADTFAFSGTVSGVGKVLQVVQSVVDGTYNLTTANSFADVSSMYVDITPSATSSKVLCMVAFHGVHVGSNCYLRLVRGSTAIGTGVQSGNKSSVNSGNLHIVGSNYMHETNFQFLDSPSTTSETRYKVQFITDSTDGLKVNRTSGDANALYTGRSSSTITVMEISA